MSDESEQAGADRKRRRRDNAVAALAALAVAILLLLFLATPTRSPVGEWAKRGVFGGGLASWAEDRSGRGLSESVPDEMGDTEAEISEGSGKKPTPPVEARDGADLATNSAASPAESAPGELAASERERLEATRERANPGSASGPPAEGAPLYSLGSSSPSHFFGSRGRGTRFVYVIDRSGSMKSGRLESAQRELVRSLQSLRPGMSFFVIFYDSAHEGMPAPGLLPATPANLRSAVSWVMSQRPARGTEPAPAVERALELKPNTVWLLSDGEFSGDAADRIRKANATAGAVIHTIAFHDRGGENVLKKIAAENKGSYRFVAGP